MGSLLRATTLWGYGELVQELGGDPEHFRRRFRITPDVENQVDTFISFDAYVRLLEASADELGCPDFGLRLSRWQGLDILGPIAVIARNAQTVLGGLEMIGRYLYIHSPALRLTLSPSAPKSGLRFTYEVTEPGLTSLVQGHEISMAIAVRIIQLLGGPNARPSTVSFTHDQRGSDAAYRETLGCPVRFAQAWCGFEISDSLACTRIESADPETRRLAAKYLESNYLPPTASLSERVAELIRRLLPTGQCTVDAIADQLALHSRSLQRRLDAEGVRCQELIDRERRALATTYLAERGLPLSQVAGLLGYAEQSTLNRSCRRWFGKTPRHYRASLTAGN
ncbi:AraC family transcriptional regulator [Mycobacterium sp. 852002-51152_SCH6134967]|uniref:AraC family transcriptional regulator n=1 Tax=Mycobacterium sp. 852002-51152_SCH6134967 TaxID=1834096 RepID=UPI0007FE985A|nr:AraC family transcriptional regulator [Mycobacterium sp. 852002-51152_SCH6134967]OBF95494.1 AraC family transcriptional regulator [Mycobacterium sp. 852002-51152_SCH6134967]